MTASRRDRIREKILARTIEVAPPPWLDTPCRLWTGPTSGNGRGGDYGRMNLDGGTVAPHIALWVVENGPIPPRKQLDHLCRRRLCVVHTEMVTHKINQKRRNAARATLACDSAEAA
jgi:hypothetical protein